MKLLGRRRRMPEIPGALTGVARVDRRTKNLVARLSPGEIAVIDHEDMDRISAEGLIERRVRAVVNASQSTTGRYPNLGPLLLCSAGVPVIDNAGQEVMMIVEGSDLAIDGERVFRVEAEEFVAIAKGNLLSVESVERAIDLAKQGIAVELERFAQNTIEYIEDERDVLLEASR